MEIKKVDDPTIKANDLICVMETGNITELRHMKFQPKQTIQKLDKDTYAIIETG